jgi:serine/threonine-protein kinase
LLHAGHPLVADFGIALAVTRAGGARITQTGLSLGTPHYMSPEQATGDRIIDARTDVYSLGAVCYEMLSGDPPHTGSTAQAIIAKVLTDKPRPLHLGRDTIPRHVEVAVERALAKLPADRFASAGEFITALRTPVPVSVPTGWSTPASYDSDPAIVSARRRQRIMTLVPWVIAIVAVGGALAIALRPAEPRLLRRFLLATPDSARLRTPTGLTIAMSPDGQRIVYTGGPEGGGYLYVRELDELEPRAIRGTDRGSNPAFSPDGRKVAFVVDGRVKVVDITGGVPTTVADTGNHPSWAEDGSILFTRGRSLWRTNSALASPQLVARIPDSAQATNFAWPRMLPGNKAALISLMRGGVVFAKLAAVRMSTGEIIDLGVDGASAWYLPTGHLVFGRNGNVLLGAPFDAKAVRVTGPVVPLIENIIVKPGGATEFAASNDGTMLYRSGSVARTLTVVSEGGIASRLAAEPRSYVWPRYSPDGRRIAVTVGGTTSGVNNDVWVFDIGSGALSRLTNDGGERPEWTPDGRSVLTVHQDPSNRRVQIQPWDGRAEPSEYTSNDMPIMDITLPRTRSGYLAVRVAVGTQRNILIAPLDSPKALRPFVSTGADEYMPVMSPDGRWLAYVSDESGRAEVYMRPVPGPGPRVQLSSGGATEPAWSPRGGTVFYRASGKLVAADLDFTESNPTVRRRDLFDDVYYSGGPSRANYAVAPDGKSFLFTRALGEESRNIITLNWFEEVRRRVGH